MLEKLNSAMVASCTCATKTPEVEWHHESCHYRLFFEAGAVIFRLRKKNNELADDNEWINKGNQEWREMYELAKEEIKQANLERDGYKYRLEQLSERDWEKINEVYS